MKRIPKQPTEPKTLSYKILCAIGLATIFFSIYCPVSDFISYRNREAKTRELTDPERKVAEWVEQRYRCDFSVEKDYYVENEDSTAERIYLSLRWPHGPESLCTRDAFFLTKVSRTIADRFKRVMEKPRSYDSIVVVFTSVERLDSFSTGYPCKKRFVYAR